MTKREILYEVLLRINGGLLTSDTTTRYGEAETYLAAAVNYLMTGNYWLETKTQGMSTINPLLVTSFTGVEIKYDTVRKQQYCDLPYRVITLPKAKALTLYTMCGKTIIPLDQGDEAMNEYYAKYKTVINYQMEGQQRAWFLNMPPLISGVRGKQIVEIGDVDDDDEILLPSDAYVKVLDLIYSWMMGEKQAPKDYVEDQKDN